MEEKKQVMLAIRPSTRKTMDVIRSLTGESYAAIADRAMDVYLGQLCEEMNNKRVTDAEGK